MQTWHVDVQVSDWKFGAIWTVLIVSYEGIRKYATQLAGTCGLLVCDEGHRLKAAQGNKTIGGCFPAEMSDITPGHPFVPRAPCSMVHNI